MKKDKGLVRIEAVFFFGIIYRIYSSLCFSSVKSTDRLYFYFISILCSDFSEQSV